MRRVFLLFVALMLTFSFLPGCGGTKAPSADEQKQTLEKTEANMEQGMEAMQEAMQDANKPKE